MLVRVPEAYLLLRPFDTTRPGLLVLDADARRIASIPLTGKPNASHVADELTKALKTPPRERLLIRVPGKAVEDISKRLSAIKGAEAPKALPGGFVEVWCAKGAVTPDQVAAMAAAAKQDLDVVEPVRVAVKAARKDADVASSLKKVAGLRHKASTEAGAVAWISRWLLKPAHLEAQGLEGDVAAVVYRFKDLPDGPSVVKHLMRPFAEKGVLSVVPRVKEGAIEVIVRPKLHEAEKTLAALQKGGLTPLEK